MIDEAWRQLKTLEQKAFSAMQDLATVYKYRRKIRHLLAENPAQAAYSLPAEARRNAREYWRRFGINISTDWHRAYAGANGIIDHRYIPEDVFYTRIEPALNRMDLARAYRDKNEYDRLFPGFPQPATLLRNMRGMYLNADYDVLTCDQADMLLQGASGEFVIKPSLESGGGRAVRPIRAREGVIEYRGEKASLTDLERDYRRDFIIQERVDQYEALKRFHPSSLNTVRAMTLRLHGCIYAVSRVIKFGDSGNFVDNTRGGGLSCGIDQHGRLNGRAFTIHQERFDAHPSTGQAFTGIIEPLSRVDAFVQNLHRRLVYSDLLSWDIGVAASGKLCLIEVNPVGQGINFLQLNNGPLFGEHTEAVLERVFGGSRANARRWA